MWHFCFHFSAGVICLCVLRQDIIYSGMEKGDLYGQGWPWTSCPLASTSRVLGLKACAMLPVYLVLGMNPGEQ